MKKKSSNTRKKVSTTTKRRKVKLKNGGLALLLFLITAGILFASYQFLELKLTIVVALLLFMEYSSYLEE